MKIRFQIVYLIVVSLGVLPCAQLSYAYSYPGSSDSDKSFYFGVGAISYNLARFGSDSTGNAGMFANNYMDINSTAKLPLGSGLKLLPSISYTPITRNDKDGEKTSVLAITAPIALSFSPLDLKLGPGALWYFVSGSGGTAVLPNGNSTATFYLPGSTSMTRSFLIDAGAGFSVDPVRFDLDGLVTDTFSGRRAVTMVLNVSYALFH